MKCLEYRHYSVAFIVFWLCPPKWQIHRYERSRVLLERGRDCHTDPVFPRHRSQSLSWPAISPLYVISHEEEAKECGPLTPSPLEQVISDNGLFARFL